MSPRNNGGNFLRKKNQNYYRFNHLSLDHGTICKTSDKFTLKEWKFQALKKMQLTRRWMKIHSLASELHSLIVNELHSFYKWNVILLDDEIELTPRTIDIFTLLNSESVMLNASLLSLFLKEKLKLSLGLLLVWTRWTL